VTPSTTRLARRSGALLLAAALPLLLAAPAHAEVPEGWSDPDEVSPLQMLTIIVGLPALLFAIIVALVLLPALAKGEKLLPSSAGQDQWFGGPGTSAGELEDKPRELGPTGGASGTW
jgi:hypothetical protein